jgi:Glutamine amidotransferase class-I
MITADDQREAGAAPATVVILDFGAQYSQLIARRVREANVYSEILPHDTPWERIAERRPAAIILTGGPESTLAPGAPGVDARLWDAGDRARFGRFARGIGTSRVRAGAARVRSAVGIERAGTGTEPGLDVARRHGFRATAGFRTVGAHADLRRGGDG